MKIISIATAFLAILLSVVPIQTNCFNTIPNVIASYDEYVELEFNEYGELEYNNMIFSQREDRKNELILDRYLGTEHDLVIPETFIIPEKTGKFKVTAINDSAFANSKYKGIVVENVILPDSIDYFGSNVFNNSTLVSVNIPKSLKFIPSHTFASCKDLRTVTFHDDIISIGMYAFQDTNITVPEKLQKRISYKYQVVSDNSKSLFYSANDDFKFSIGTYENTDNRYCKIEEYTGSSSDIVIPESFCDIPVISVNLSQNDTSAITSVTFPKTSQNISIESESFKNSAITELTINSPCTLGKMTFADCTDLKTVKFNKDVTMVRGSFSGCTSLTSVEFCGNANLDQYAFIDCHSIENITLDTSQTIRGDAFNGCMSLMNINSQPGFDSAAGDFAPEFDSFIRDSFYMAEEIGFLNEYVKSRYKQIADEVTDPDMSDTEKIKALHDWVCQNTKYADGDTNLAKYHTDASILLNDSTVCEGYAKAFNLLCHYAGIESYYVCSRNHAWNIVKIGGHYFHVDTTWDDKDDVTYLWFLKSDSEMSANDSHEEWQAYSPSSLHNFQKDDIPECRYQIGDVNRDGEISAADLITMNRWLLNAETETEDNIVLYDLNHDGNADIYDMVFMRKIILNQ